MSSRFRKALLFLILICLTGCGIADRGADVPAEKRDDVFYMGNGISLHIVSLSYPEEGGLDVGLKVTSSGTDSVIGIHAIGVNGWSDDGNDFLIWDEKALFTPYVITAPIKNGLETTIHITKQFLDDHGIDEIRELDFLFYAGKDDLLSIDTAVYDFNKNGAVGSGIFFENGEYRDPKLYFSLNNFSDHEARVSYIVKATGRNGEKIYTRDPVTKIRIDGVFFETKIPTGQNIPGSSDDLSGFQWEKEDGTAVLIKDIKEFTGNCAAVYRAD